MKKFISLMLALVLVLSMATVAFAAEDITGKPGDASIAGHTVTIKKNYEVNGATAENPAEEFRFTIESGKVEKGGVINEETGEVVTTSPAAEISSVSYEAGEASTTAVKNITVTLPAYQAVGVYYYTIKETPASTAGVTYFTDLDDAEGDPEDEIITLIVTVEQTADGRLAYGAVHCESPVSPSYEEGSTKTDTFKNTYEAGSLTVEKQVEGNMGDRNKEFAFTVTFTPAEGKEFAPNQNVNDSYTAVKNDDGSWTYQFNLSDDGKAIFENIPAGTAYTVSEASYTEDGYTTKYDGKESGTVTNEAVSTVVTNTKTADVDTGITMDSAPYILLIAVCAGAAALFVINKRRSVDF